MKKFLKNAFLVVAILLLVALVLGFIAHEPLPKGTKGQEAEKLLAKVQEAINQKAWESTAALTWSFMGHHYLWDKQNNWVQVKWGDKTVFFNTKNQEGKAYDEAELEDGEDAQDLIATAIKYFNNDSFWLAAPFKLNDPGTESSVVEIDGEKALKITYTSGGDTPGDSYVWLLDEDGTPKAWKMWVKIIPVGGIEFQWTDWKTFSNGVKIATTRKGFADLTIENLNLGKSVEAINEGVNPFQREKLL